MFNDPPKNLVRHAAALFRRWSRLSLFMGLVTCIIAFYTGCGSPEERYRTLSFFFDGVPRPDGTLPEEYLKRRDPWYAEKAAEDAKATAAAADTASAKQFIYHKPYTQHDCDSCHASEAGYAVIEDVTKTCKKCHATIFEREEGDWVHGPVVFNQCDRCHTPHKSEFAGLLKQSQPDLCHTCHDARFVETDPFHKTLTDRTCSNCHDPHHAGNRKLLVDSDTFARRREDKSAGSAHPDWEREDCGKCHLTDRSNMLREDVDTVCLSCHADSTKADDGPKLHAPVKQGKCTACHTPHESPRKHLIHPVAEKNCTPCHAVEKLDKNRHPVVHEVECLMCHGGHRTQRTHLLKPGIATLGNAPKPEPGREGG